MKTIKQNKFTIDLEEGSIVVRSGEFKYTAPFSYDLREIDEDGYVDSKITLDDGLTMEVYGQTFSDFPSDILYQLDMNIEEALDEVKEFLDEQSKQDAQDEKQDLRHLNNYYWSTRGVK